MKMLLTSGGVKNPSLHKALIDLLGKPTAECNALCIATANYGQSRMGAARAWSFITGHGSTTPMVELGWKSMGVLELTALPSLPRDYWLPAVQEADALLVNGGDPLYLGYWMKQSGLADLLPTLSLVYVGLSAGSMIMAPRIGEDFANWRPPSGGDETLGLVNFAMFPHLDHPSLPDNTLPAAEKWAAAIGLPAYAIDDDTGFKVVDGAVEVISEGHWKQLAA